LPAPTRTAPAPYVLASLLGAEARFADGDDAPRIRPTILSRLVGGHRTLSSFWDAYRAATGIVPGTDQDRQNQLSCLMGFAWGNAEVHKSPSFEDVPEVVDALQDEGIQQLGNFLSYVTGGMPQGARRMIAEQLLRDPGAALDQAVRPAGFEEIEAEGEIVGDPEEDPDLASLEAELRAIESRREGEGEAAPWGQHAATTADADAAARDLLLCGEPAVP